MMHDGDGETEVSLVVEPQVDVIAQAVVPAVAIIAGIWVMMTTSFSPRENLWSGFPDDLVMTGLMILSMVLLASVTWWRNQRNRWFFLRVKDGEVTLEPEGGEAEHRAPVAEMKIYRFTRWYEDFKIVHLVFPDGGSRLISVGRPMKEFPLQLLRGSWAEFERALGDVVVDAGEVDRAGKQRAGNGPAFWVVYGLIWVVVASWGLQLAYLGHALVVAAAYVVGHEWAARRLQKAPVDVDPLVALGMAPIFAISVGVHVWLGVWELGVERTWWDLSAGLVLSHMSAWLVAHLAYFAVMKRRAKAKMMRELNAPINGDA